MDRGNGPIRSARRCGALPWRSEIVPGQLIEATAQAFGDCDMTEVRELGQAADRASGCYPENRATTDRRARSVTVTLFRVVIGELRRFCTPASLAR